MNKWQLMEYIDRVSFAMDDTRLFLDTHPEDKKALDYFMELKELRKKAVYEYTTTYGPIMQYNVDADGSWNWNQGPLPWEIGGCK